MAKAKKAVFERLYDDLNRRKYVSPDPLQFLYDYEDSADREIVGLVASSLAYGRVAQILKSVDKVLSAMDGPKKFLESSSFREIKSCFKNFKHRFTTGEHLARMLYAAKRANEEYGSLEACFESGIEDGDPTVLQAMSLFTTEMDGLAEKPLGYLLPTPDGGSACKRFNLFLRWMGRKDAVDSGGWKCLDPSLLVIPLDTHMYQICSKLGFTKRKQANLKTAVEITDAFRKICPADPVKYDFALTRLGIRTDTDLDGFLNSI